MELSITQEMIEDIISRKIEEAIDGVSIEDLVRERVNRNFDSKIAKAVSDAVAEKCAATTEAKAGEFLKEPVVINDGWGGRKEYGSYADFYASVLEEKFKGYQFDKLIERVVRDKVESSISGKADAIRKRICEEVIVEVDDD